MEIAIIGEHELTLPPASFPWDEFDRRDKVWEADAGPQAGPGGAGAGVAAALAAPGSYLRTVAELMWGLSCCMGDGHRTSRWY